MKLYKTPRGIIIEHQHDHFLSNETDWNKFINRPGLHAKILAELAQLKAEPTLAARCQTSALAPVEDQEVWASGVTYLRSREARMEESKDAGGGDFYARVYEADRPELFFKAPAYRTVGPRQAVRIRKDSRWNVPEPELTLFVCTAGSIEGYTVGNDMSSRDIEGENPLYLPQAKSYDGATALGPCLFVPERPIAADTTISIVIQRQGKTVFSNEISIDRMKRKHTELVEYLFREVSFPYGTFLMTGTGIVPPDDFTLQANDVIRITIDGIGTLENTVA
ncbi:fumarylacetoacetate hydrolase family protein [Dawidia soli]|uniref:Fumarylacetoacetate hydrolase family protein n=1 Tax=Dawidia soli TaxID=2782352 RepID=A0AAP2DDH3_9BACT|nr:fumarylacetoacetate hydrolase family protein [Dawidia soli]MBT1689171.1 fumarylacetoacetate hydrolase family protein [Dawidia soli]